MIQFFIIFVFLITSAAYPVFAAEDVYQDPKDFIAESFQGSVPPEKILSIDPDLKEKISKIMGTHYKLGNTAYWAQEGRTVWILEDIGKYEPITVGIVVSPDATLERIKVLIYRESHGWEVKHAFFTRQFEGSGLKRERKLDQSIDGIAGATLSVKALKRLGTLALLLHSLSLIHI